MKQAIVRPLYVCGVCGHRWFARTKAVPLRCGGCKSPYWNRKSTKTKEKAK